MFSLGVLVVLFETQRRTGREGCEVVLTWILDLIAAAGNLPHGHAVRRPNSVFCALFASAFQIFWHGREDSDSILDFRQQLID